MSKWKVYNNGNINENNNDGNKNLDKLGKFWTKKEI